MAREYILLFSFDDLFPFTFLQSVIKFVFLSRTARQTYVVRATPSGRRQDLTKERNNWITQLHSTPGQTHVRNYYIQ